ncbi:efflux RND transporter periplasmic adaptor subunit [Ponticoccus sp. SC2-23]|uniref:efflux RND transporter periplasmic adaptor subunit n=1 Tax=Alexandriicola marinus TaxID=2081710 RepID=UPI000FD97C30|nr:efflux RND transporter periplasmic adaptor subunit [Alexandriicola marinus]MBM1221396.1 efflux RND transporter periplasmic adaptor subunit [Ponticoccus sp. SC6-9]MBM1226437.1 efflux RND transporter periplasmic adaptor subunit [Ponticoccus sp. SC6-15]MBM1230388.1 efflux RND transporter periplasmic adaptor subunit [Ponticoccus sp. SC6-38]MBM1234911.1 efflux RND transporter periplasmic adaptor subunit [Ponticoccus sp. SC6-45]MBM1239409.1 efflux RND transporter periplasmic adaptor subunit [Pont
MSSDQTRAAMPRIEADGRATSLVTVPRPPKPPQPGHKRRTALVVVALAGVAFALAGWGLSGGGAVSQAPVTTLAAGPVERVLAVSGRTNTDVQSDIRSVVSARVTEVDVTEGDRVAVGDPLVLLDAAAQQSRIRQALAALDAAILREQSARADRDRALDLGRTMSDVARADAERDLALASAEVDRQRAALEQAQLALPDYRITAPIGGVVLDRTVEPGDLVTPSDILLRIADPGDLHVEVQVDEIYADKVQTGQRAWLQLAGRTETLPGEVSFVAAQVDERTGSLRVNLAFDTVPEAQIGLTTVANILIDRVEAGLTLPRGALVSSGPDAAVFVLRDGRASLTSIEYVDWPADRVEITSGLSEGDRVVLSPEGIVDGQELSARDTPETGG